MFTKNKYLDSDLHAFLGTVIVLVIIGFLFIYSASSVFALETFGSSAFFVKRQLIGLFIGCIMFFIARIIALEFVYVYSPIFFVISLCLTIFTLIPSLGITIHGSSRWLQIGSFSFQPSELLKIAFIIFLARFFTKRAERPFSCKKDLVPILCIVGLCGIILLKQPDFGLTITLLITACIMLFISEMPLKILFALFTCFIPLTCYLIYQYPYRLKRIMIFLNPWNDPQGAGFQIIQSLIAIGSGSWLGNGIAHSKQKFFYLPMQHTDFIFAIIAEETGFIGSVIIILLYLFFTYFGLRIAWQLKNTFQTFIIIGYILSTSLQALINFCVTSGLLPTKGIGLPFISYGNTALVCNLAMIGLITNMAKRAQ